MKKITKSEAIKQARLNISQLFKSGNGYKFLIWDEKKQAWIDGGVYEFWFASWKRSQAMVDVARDLLGKSWKEYTGVGRWTDSV